MTMMQSQRPTPRNRGRAFSRPAVTLVELVMIIAIAGVLAAIAVPKTISSQSRQRALAAARRIAADLEYVRARAIASSASRRFYVGPDRGTYASDAPSSVLRAGVTLSTNLTESPYKSKIIGASFGDDAAVQYTFATAPERAALVIFDGYGIPDTSGWVFIRCSDVYYQVVLDASGRASVVPSNVQKFTTAAAGPGALLAAGG
jgi:Tfp pilus assembly protein FimT